MLLNNSEKAPTFPRKLALLIVAHLVELGMLSNATTAEIVTIISGLGQTNYFAADF
jgi:phosphoglycolate phosphatase-like HAD superfamily hydrolase